MDQLRCVGAAGEVGHVLVTWQGREFERVVVVAAAWVDQSDPSRPAVDVSHGYLAGYPGAGLVGLHYG